MKSKLILMLLLLSAVSNAQATSTTKLQNTDDALSTIINGEVLSAANFYPPCPPNALCSPATLVKIQLPLSGCADRLGPVSHKVSFNEESGKYTILISAINIHNELSKRIMCLRQATAEYKVLMRPFLEMEEIEIKFMK
ncbi:MAG: hypothetical protein HN509_16525 [Halobacteriovoraceae bacterium]|mgnify:FL=1|jgi:hypothetical protein|nr:hypothetical protein [Halobacteriovoraceae bacterium]MBT5092826.1 hypothetical protein [Halobacteriovoraceae bacterium]